jgi:hypothetical protein
MLSSRPVAADAERALQHTAEFARIVLSAAFEPAEQFALAMGRRTACRLPGCNVEIDEDQPAVFRRSRKNKVNQVVSIGSDSVRRPRVGYVGKLFEGRPPGRPDSR